MQLAPYQNSFGINGNHQNNMIIVAAGIANIIIPLATVVGCCAFAHLLPPCSPKLGLTYLRNEAH
jgi:hypothetical protein